jgi:hypothetical protein
MTFNDKNGGAKIPVATGPAPELVTRSNVPSGMEYGEYRKYLRYDFIYSCAYCTMSEAEALAIRFTIDHYEPRKARPDLKNEYSNLMYSCDACNQRKGDRCPPPEARNDDYRFFRPDKDVYQDHFQRNGIRLDSKSNVGTYSIEALDLNRLALRRLRKIRERLTKCDQLVTQGVLGLRKFHIDQLPPNVKGAAALAIKEAVSVANQIVSDIDSLLRGYAHSPFIDDDPESKSRYKERSDKLKQLEALHPGNWRAPRKKRD